MLILILLAAEAKWCRGRLALKHLGIERVIDACATLPRNKTGD